MNTAVRSLSEITNSFSVASVSPCGESCSGCNNDERELRIELRNL